MVHRWHCRHCEFSVWSASREPTVDAVKSHLLEHYRDNVRQTEFQIEWTCPYCERTSEGYDREEGIERFTEHLFGHVEPLLDSDVHVAEAIGGSGDVLVLSPLEATGADNARVHFTAPADVLVLVTATPAQRVRLLSEQLQSWPAWTVVITTNQRPLAGLDDIDLESAPLEVVILDKQSGISKLGKTIVRVLEENETDSAQVSVGFDILGDLLELYDLETVFKFVHLLTTRLDRVDALGHFYLDPNDQPKSTVNMFENLFDLQLRATGNRFVSEGGAGTATNE